MMKNLQRDFVGYGPTPPDAAWPEGRPRRREFRDQLRGGFGVLDRRRRRAFRGSADRGGGSARSGRGSRPLRREHVRVWQQGGDLARRATVHRAGLAGHRLRRAPLRSSAIPSSRSWCATTAGTSAATVCAGSSIICSTKQTERRMVSEAVASLVRTIGERPLGWYCRYAPSERTRRILVEEGGFLYDSDSYADDLPFWVNVDGHAHLVVPYSLVTNDVKILSGNADERRFFHDSARRFRRPARRGAHPSEDDVGRHSSAPSRASCADRRALAIHGLRPGGGGRMGLPPGRHRASLGETLPPKLRAASPASR